MFIKTKLCRGLMLAFGGSLALGGLPAFGQQAAAPTQLDRVEITGSSIKRLAAEQSLPVQVLKADDLANLGVTNAEQVMQFITSNQSSTNTTQSVGSSNGGASYANLRGLGDERTLVLLNGKRMVNNPYSSAAVDLNTIPFGAIDRIEVLTDGASAIYGSDAISGVINFITRKEYQGVSLDASGMWPQESGGGQNYTAGITAGTGSLADQGWNIFGGLSYNKQNALKATDRDYSKTAYMPDKGFDKTSGRTFPSNYYQLDAAGENITMATNPSLPNCNPPSSLPFPDRGQCRYDYVTDINMLPEQEQWSAIVKGSLAVNKDNTVSLEYVQGNNKVYTVIAATPFDNLQMNPNSPFFPGAGITPTGPDAGALDPTLPIYANWRTTQIGGRQSEFENKTYRVLLNWDGSYKGWDYSVNLFQSKADVTNTFTGGYVNSTALTDGLLGANGAPFLNPFGDQTPEGQAYLNASRVLGQVQQAEGTLNSLNAQISGEVYKMPAGPMMLAVGVEFTKDEATYTNNFALIRGAASSGLELAQDSSGDRRDNAIFAELNIPIIKELEVNLAIRYDDYSDFGGTTNPKISFRWQPMQQLLFRGSYNQGFRAPTLQDVYSPTQLTNTGDTYDDPLLCPGGVVNTAAGGLETRDCDIQFNQQYAGNRNLQPETSKAWSLGVAFQPMENVTLGVDYWNYNVSDSIGNTGEAIIFGDPTKYADRFVRCGDLSVDEKAAISQCGPGSNDNVLAYIENPTLNLGSYKTSGVDMVATWQSPVMDFGRFNVGYRGTYVFTYEYQLEPGGAWNNNLGVYFNGNPVSRYRQFLNFGWQYGAWAAQLANRYSGAYQDQDQTLNADGSTAVVAGTNTWDLSATWSGVKGLAITGTISNLFDQTPPYSNQGDQFQVGFDPRYSNPIGRAFMLRGSYQF